MRSLAVLVLVAALLSGCSALRSDDEATCWLKHTAISTLNLALVTEWGIEVEANADRAASWGNVPSMPDKPDYRGLPDCEALG